MQETLEFKLTETKKLSYLGLDSNLRVGLTSLEIYNSVLKTTGENKNFDFDPDNFVEFSFTKLKDNVAENFWSYRFFIQASTTSNRWPKY